jgi:hypothetical protein
VESSRGDLDLLRKNGRINHCKPGDLCRRT